MSGFVSRCRKVVRHDKAFEDRRSELFPVCCGLNDRVNSALILKAVCLVSRIRKSLRVVCSCLSGPVS